MNTRPGLIINWLGKKSYLIKYDLNDTIIAVYDKVGWNYLKINTSEFDWLLNNEIKNEELNKLKEENNILHFELENISEINRHLLNEIYNLKLQFKEIVDKSEERYSRIQIKNKK